MPRQLSIVILLALLALVVLASGCGSAATSTPEPPAATLAPPTSAPAAPAATAAMAGTPSTASNTEIALRYVRRIEDRPLAMVNGEAITWEDYEPGLRQTLLAVNQQNTINWEDAAMQARLLQLQNDVLRQVVDRLLLRELARQQGAELSAEELDAQIAKEKASVLESGRYATWEEFLKVNGLTDNSFAQVIEDTLLYNKLLAAQVVDTQGEQIELAHIVVGTEADAREVEARLQAGESYEALAAEYSLDTQTKDNGGVLGWFTKDMMQAEIGEKAWTLEPGQVSGIISTANGFSILKVVAREVRELEARALRQRQQEAVVSLLSEVRAAANIEYLVDFQAEE
jgi:parvulin-like peptidyl-prolyl isomerase